MNCHCHWYKCHIMPTASSMSLLLSLGKDNWNEVQHHLCVFSMIPLALVLLSCDAIVSVSTSCGLDSAISGTIAFLRLKQFAVQYVMSLVLVSVSHDANAVISGTCAFFRSMTIKLMKNMIFLVTDTIVTFAFLRSRQLKWGATWLLWWCDNIGVGIGITQCQHHHQWHCYIPGVKMIKLRWNMTFLVMCPNRVVYI